MATRKAALLITVSIISLSAPSFGEHAAELATGAAAIIAASAPIAISGIQADADVDIAKMNNQYNLAQASLVSNTNLEMADKAIERSKAETNRDMAIAAINQKGATDRTWATVQAQDRQSQRDFEYNMQRSRMEFEVSVRRIQQEEREAADKRYFAERALEAQQTLQALQPNTDPSAGLRVRPVTRSTASSTY